MSKKIEMYLIRIILLYVIIVQCSLTKATVINVFNRVRQLFAIHMLDCSIAKSYKFETNNKTGGNNFTR